MSLDRPVAIESAIDDERETQFDVHRFDGPISDHIASFWSQIRSRRRGLLLPLAMSLMTLMRGDSLLHVLFTLTATLGALYLVNRLLRRRSDR